MKKSKKILLVIPPVLSVILFNACAGNDSEEETSRDVYQNREDCLKDWNDGELCEPMNDSDANQYRSTHSGGGSMFFMGSPFWGPRYYPSDRSVYYKGRAITPSTRSSAMPPFRVTSASSAASRGGSARPSGARSSSSWGGFGGRSSSGS